MIGISLPVQSVLVSMNILAIGREQTGTFIRCFRVYHKALGIEPGHNRSFEMLTRFRGGSLHIARFLCLAQQGHPLANKFAHIGKVLEARTVVSESGSRRLLRVLTFVFEPRRTELRSRSSISFSFIFLTAS